MTCLRSRSMLVAGLSLLAATSPAVCAAAAPPTSRHAGQPWVWPLEPVPRVIRVFDAPADPWSSGHRGVDLLGAAGQPVMAISAGRVRFARAVAGRGVVVISHGALRSTYEPVTAAVHVGEQVRAGEVVGLLQTVQSHCAPEVCLHLGLRRGSVYLDPLSLLGPRPVRLKPLTSADRSSSDAIHPAPPPKGSEPPATSSRASDSAAGRRHRTVGAAVTAAVAFAVASVLTVFNRAHARG
jgi:murein DD-endopeptidase MepM/ murein hydrolase activator NlpD